MRDLVNGNINKKSVGRELKDIEHIFKFGEYSIFQFPIKDLEDAETRVKDFTKWLLNREGKAFGLFKCYSFYILVYSFVNSLTRLKNVYKVYDGVSGKTIKSGIVIKNHQVDNIPYTSSSKRNYKVRKRNYKSW